MKKKAELKRIFGVAVNGSKYALFFSWWNGKKLPKCKFEVSWFEKVDELNQFLRDTFGPDVARVSV